MRNISFRFLWLFWSGSIVYSFGATALGIFPSRTLADRLSDNFDTAWFICGAWLVRWAIDFTSHRPASVGTGKQP